MKGTAIYLNLLQEAAIIAALVVLMHVVGWRSTARFECLFGLSYLACRVVRVGRAMLAIVALRKDPIANYLYLVRQHFGAAMKETA